jgi:Flp pilus assembly protein TadG
MIERPTIRRRGEDGSVAVEFAVTVSALMFLIIGAIQFALVFWNWNTMLLAVEEAGRYAMLYNATNFPGHPPGCADTIANCAANWAKNNLGSGFEITPSTGTDASGNPTLTFTATYSFEFLTTITLTRAIQVPVI